MLPPAPGRLSTISGCFSRSSILLATRRVNTSNGPPAVEVAMIRTGLSGYVCAPAPTAHAAATAVKQSAAESLAIPTSCSDRDMSEGIQHARVRDHLVHGIAPRAGALDGLVLIAPHHIERRLPFRQRPVDREVRQRAGALAVELHDGRAHNVAPPSGVAHMLLHVLEQLLELRPIRTPPAHPLADLGAIGVELVSASGVKGGQPVVELFLVERDGRSLDEVAHRFAVQQAFQAHAAAAADLPMRRPHSW